jgi:phosphate transport system substrate-binding protein
MSDQELANAKGGPVLHFPTVMGAVVITYNVPGVSRPLNLSGDVIADIFSGNVTKWNDARIVAQNRGVALPNSDILVVHRSDGSGTTYIFSDYLTSVSPSWCGSLGKGKEIKWPVGLGGKGNEGVAGQVKQMAGSIGYVELAYAKQNKLAYANVRNAAGAFVTPSISSVTAAAASMKLPKNTDYRVSIVNAPGRNSYPISSLTWILVYQNQLDHVKGAKLVNFLRWAYKNGEQTASALDYAPLPAPMVAALQNRLKTVNVNGASNVGATR